MIIFLKENLSWFLKKKKKKRIFLLIISFDALDACVNLETLRLTISIETQIFLKKIKKKKKNQNKIEKKKNSLVLKFFSISSI